MTRNVTIAAYWIVVLATALFLWRQPVFNWDLLPYVAIAKEMQGVSPDNIHRDTYRDVRAEVPGNAYVVLIDRNDYRRALAADSASFRQQIPFYAVKPLYPALIAAINLTGISYVASGHLLSLVGFLGLAALSFAWCRAHVPLGAAAILSYLIVLQPHVTHAARLVSPDTISAFLVISGLYVCFEKRREALGVMLILAATLARPDNAVFAVLVPLFMYAIDRKGALRKCAWASAGVAVYAIQVSASGNYGWTTLFYHTFVENLVSPSGFVSPLGLPDYMQIYVKQVIELVGNEGVVMLMLLSAAVAAFLCAYIRVPRGRDFPLLAVVVGAAACKFAAYPTELDRMFLPCYLMISILLVTAIGRLTSSESTATRPGSERT